MPDFDTSNVAATVGGQTQNPLATVGQFAQVQNALNANRLYPLLYQQHAVGLQTSQQALAKAQYDAYQSAVASTTDDSEVGPLVARLTQAGVLQPDFAAAALGGNVPGLDAGSISRLREQAINAAGNPAELAADRGVTSTQDIGGQIDTLNTKVQPGGETDVTQAGGPAGQLPKTLTPETLGGYVGIKRNDGSMINVPRSTIETPQGTGIPNVPGPDGQPLTGSHGEVLGALPSGQEGALASGIQNQQDRANTLQSAFEGSAQRKALAEEMLQANGEFRSGPGAAKWGNIVTEANRIFGTNFAADPTTAQQVAGKIAQMLSAQQRDTLGLPATNAGQEAANIASPNTAYSAGAIQTLAGQLAGNEDLIQKKQAAWTAYQKAGGSYNGFVNQFNRTYDPRFFWDQYVPDQQKAEAGMTPAQTTQYEKRRDQAMGLKF